MLQNSINQMVFDDVLINILLMDSTNVAIEQTGRFYLDYKIRLKWNYLAVAARFLDTKNPNG